MGDKHVCTKCGEEKTKDNFCRHRKWCKSCLRQYAKEYRNNPDNRRKALDGNKRRKFGLTRDELAKMLERQDGKCEICRKQIESLDGRGTHVDHCHATGKVRGILCHNCNVGLGYFSDSIFSLARAIEYLQA